MNIFFGNKRNFIALFFFVFISSILIYSLKKHKNINNDLAKEITCPKSPLIVAYFGQSNSANSVNSINRLKIPDNLYQYNWKDNNCYEYKEPLLGATGNKGNSITPFAIKLAQNTRKDILIVPYGIGSTLVESWANGDLRLLNEDLLFNLKRKSLNINLFLFHQGESNSGMQKNYVKNIKKTKKINYSRDYLVNLLKIIDHTRLYFPDSYFGLALVSKCFTNESNIYIRNSQRKVTELRSKVFISADSDSIFGKKYRYDNCHFNELGAELLSNMYIESFKNNFSNSD